MYISLVAPADLLPLPAAIEVTLFRIAQEVLTRLYPT
jgi:signal transduction histidine kinase